MARVFHLMQLGMAALLARATVGGVGSNLTAAGTNQATAFQLDATKSIFTTVATGTGVRLHNPADVNNGDEVGVVNLGANALLVYPPVGGTIQGAAANAAFSVPAGKTATFMAADQLNYAVNLSA